jgi:hypothetical protein
VLIRPSFVFGVLVYLLSSGSAAAATLRVCSSGCSFSTLQPAIDAAVPGDTILLAAGQTFVGPFILRAKPGASWITIRSDAADSSLPADGVRLVPSDKPGGNTNRSLLPRLVGQGGALATTPVLRTEPGAHHYVLKFLEIDGSANGGLETLIALGESTTAAVASDIVLDRVYAHGHPSKGQKRGIALNSIRTDVVNSYLSDFKAVSSDAQAICGYNGAGPFKIINNYLEGSGENVMFGGADPAISNLVPADIQILRNHFYKPLEWRNPILGAPGSPRATATTGGALGAGTYYFRIVAVMDTGYDTAVSSPSTAVAATTGNSGAVTLTWSGVAGADRYRVYRGTSATSQGTYMETSSSSTTLTYTASGERGGSTPTQGTYWLVKNLLELKNAERVRIEGNLIENIWAAGQFGYALVLTPRNQDGGAPWVRVRDVVIANNVIRHAAGGVQITGYDYPNVSQQTQRVSVQNNLFDDIDNTKWGGSARVFVLGDGVASLTIDRNTIIHKNTAIVFAYGSRTFQNFVYTNNIAEHREYGITGDNGQPGQYSIDMYFPGSTVSYNVLAGGISSRYPATNSFPTTQEWFASFANFASGDYRVLSTSPFYRVGAGGSVPGANLSSIDAAIGLPIALPSAAPSPPTGVRVITGGLP